jgi:hypothetical protein
MAIPVFEAALPSSLTDELLLAFASTVILVFLPRGTHDRIVLHQKQYGSIFELIWCACLTSQLSLYSMSLNAFHAGTWRVAHARTPN